MSDDELFDALERAADIVPDRDLSQTAWYAGRSRKRRTSRAWWGAGGAVAAAAVVGAVAWGGGALQLPDSGPAGTAGDDSRQTSDAEPTLGGDEQPVSGQPTVLQFIDGSEEVEPTGVLEPWAPPNGTVSAWLLQEVMGSGGAGVTLTFDSGLWLVRGCGLDMKAPGAVEDGRARVTGTWEIDPDPDPGAACVSHPWLDAARWESFLGEGPLVARDGTTLLMSGTIGAQPVFEPVSAGFARADVTDPQVGPARAATWDDLAQDWVEAPLEYLTAQIHGREFVDTEPDPETDLQLTSPEVGVLRITGPGCVGGGFTQSWLLPTGGTSLFLDPEQFRTAIGCFEPGARQESLVTGMLTGGAEISVHGDYLVIDGWVDPAFFDPQPTVDTRPALLSPPTQLPELKQLTHADTLLPEVLAVPGDGIPALAEDPTDTFVAAFASEDHDNALLILGSDQRWRTAATGVGLVTPTPHLLIGGSPPLLDTSVSPTGHQLAHRTNEGIVIVTASTGDVVQHQAGGQYPDTVPHDFLWLDDNRLGVNQREDRAMVIDTSTGEVTHDASWNQLREIAPWRIIVQAEEDEESGELAQSGPVVLQRLDAAGEVAEETPLGFTSQPGYLSVLAEDRVATVITTQDPTVIESEGWQGEVPESVSLVLVKDGTLDSLSVLQADAETVTPVRWGDRGTLIVRVAGDGLHHYVLWDTQNGGTQLLTQVDLPLGQGPVFGDLGR
ncbi:hypothetical protein MWU75_07425 [Ornithinimicrobium sp. F0845]|uniref:hypothetical protein n=1 Tax=Ornithinimicrobium sp. F0845 TaxID=2926412 RepID=UPI001FF358C7|nr:hypothetical protein [Ornithinimicrobium sp. F0845]MCK0111966.1 hypothetical protein [Ornithinimicrobium sp. F0845]